MFVAVFAAVCTAVFGTGSGWWRRHRRRHRRTDPPDTAELSDLAGPGAVALPSTAPDNDALPAGASPLPAAPDGDQLDAVALERLTDYIGVQVRSGVHDPARLRVLAVEAAEAETPDPAVADEVARLVLSDALAAWRTDAEQWLGRTDPERLDRALARLRESGVVTLSAVEDSGELLETLRVRGCPHGAVAYLVTDVWDALDGGVLALRVFDADAVPALRGTAAVAAVMDALAAEGLLGVPAPAAPTAAPVPPAGSGVATGVATAENTAVDTAVATAEATAVELPAGDASVLVSVTWRRRPPA